MLCEGEGSTTADAAPALKRHQEYSYRLPTPPRIVVPPPMLSSGLPGLHVGGYFTYSQEELDTSFLKEMDLNDLIQGKTLLEWTYERRRQAQMILPWLYLGPLAAAKDRTFLQGEGITMVLAVRIRENSMNGVVDSARQVCQEVATIEAPTVNALVPLFPKTTTLINRHMVKMRQLAASSGTSVMGKVLVFCESGNDKSAAVVAAYLMDMLDSLDHVHSMQVCQAQRFCVNFDDGIKNVLRSYWDILQAQRAVAGSRMENTVSVTANHGLQYVQAQTSKAKRTIEELQDEDVDMDDGMDPADVLRFANRDNTPFQD